MCLQHPATLIVTAITRQPRAQVLARRVLLLIHSQGTVSLSALMIIMATIESVFRRARPATQWRRISHSFVLAYALIIPTHTWGSATTTAQERPSKTMLLISVIRPARLASLQIQSRTVALSTVPLATTDNLRVLMLAIVCYRTQVATLSSQTL